MASNADCANGDCVRRDLVDIYDQRMYGGLTTLKSTQPAVLRMSPLQSIKTEYAESEASDDVYLDADQGPMSRDISDMGATVSQDLDYFSCQAISTDPVAAFKETSRVRRRLEQYRINPRRLHLHVLHVIVQLLLWVVAAVMTILFWPVGLLIAIPYHRNKKATEENHRVLNVPLTDHQSLRTLLGHVPSWLSTLGQTENVDWLNTLLAEIWPVLDKPVCDLIRSSIEPVLEQYKPPFITKMGFKKLTLGELPVKLEGLRVLQTSEPVEMEVDFRWRAQPNISFLVELALVGPYTRMVPKLSDLAVSGTVKIVGKPPVNKLTGVGALLIALTNTPHIKFRLDFGPLMGGKLTARLVASFLDPFLRETLANMLVWPNRIVVPILEESEIGPLDALQLRSVGLLHVQVVEARGLKKMDWLSKSDPEVELFTQSSQVVVTKTKSRTVNPKWSKEHFQLLVQEPDSQVLRVNVNDVDWVNVKELMRLNILRGARQFIRSRNLIGRVAIPLRSVCACSPEEVDDWYKLGVGDWSSDLDTWSEDYGEVRLRMQYKPFADPSGPIGPHTRGVLFVVVKGCKSLPCADWHSGTFMSSDPYVIVQIKDQQRQTARVLRDVNPVFNTFFEFFDVEVDDLVKFKVYDHDWFSFDDFLGRLDVPLSLVVEQAQATLEGWFPLHDTGKGTIGVKLQFMPYG